MVKKKERKKEIKVPPQPGQDFILKILKHPFILYLKKKNPTQLSRWVDLKFKTSKEIL